MLHLKNSKVPAKPLVHLIPYIRTFFKKISLQGGFACGNAFGNTYTLGEEPMADQPALRKKGKILVYISNKDPSTVVPTETPPSFQCSVPVVHMSKSLFEALGKKSPSIKNPGILYYFNQ